MAEAEHMEPLRKIPRLLLMIFALLPFPQIASELFRHPFYPSHAWVALVHSIAVWAGALVAVIWTVYLFLDFRRRKMRSGATFLKALLILPIYSGLSTFIATISLFPMATALAAGEETELRYAVLSSNSESEHRCSSPVILDDMPLFFDRVCGFHDEFRKKLPPGSQLWIGGSGTAWGVFATEFRPAANPIF